MTPGEKRPDALLDPVGWPAREPRHEQRARAAHSWSSLPFKAQIRSGDVLCEKFRIDSVLGVGGIAFVVSAVHLELEDYVAIKLLRPELRNDKDALVRFSDEARVAAQIKSDHVARVLDVGRSREAGPFIVMERLQGRDLSRVLEDEGRLPCERVARYALETCEGLAAAHSAGIVHRDIKPDNLFLAQQTHGTELIKILDFGISKAERESGMRGRVATFTDAVVALGSPPYMSPEQMRASHHLDERTDIWSLGCVLYELLCGSPPFEAPSVMQLCAAVLEQAPVPPSARVPGLSKKLDAIVFRCLEKDPALRFQNVAELAHALSPFAPARSRLSVERCDRALAARRASPRVPLMAADPELTSQAAPRHRTMPPPPPPARTTSPAPERGACPPAVHVLVPSSARRLMEPAPPETAPSQLQPQPQEDPATPSEVHQAVVMAESDGLSLIPIAVSRSVRSEPSRSARALQLMAAGLLVVSMGALWAGKSHIGVGRELGASEHALGTARPPHRVALPPTAASAPAASSATFPVPMEAMPALPPAGSPLPATVAAPLAPAAAALARPGSDEAARGPAARMPALARGRSRPSARAAAVRPGGVARASSGVARQRPAMPTPALDLLPQPSAAGSATRAGEFAGAAPTETGAVAQAEFLREDPFPAVPEAEASDGSDLAAAGSPAAPALASSAGSPRTTAQPASALPASAVDKVIRAHADAVQECYERAQLDHPDLQGRLQLEATIDAQGNVIQAASSTLRNGARLSACVVAAARSWKFPAPVGAALGRVSYTFVFD